MCTENQRRNRQIEAYDRSHNTRIIQVCQRRRRRRRRRRTGGSATKRDTLSFKLEGRWVGSVERVGSGLGVCWGRVEASQGPVSGLVFSHNVLAAAQLLPHVRHLHAESSVLLLQEAGPDGDLVLLQPPSVP